MEPKIGSTRPDETPAPATPQDMGIETYRKSRSPDSVISAESSRIVCAASW